MRALSLNADRFHLGIELEYFGTHLTTPAGLFVSSEGHRRVEDIITVDPDGSRLHGLGHPVGFAEILGPDGPRQTERRVVHLGGNFFGFFERHRANDGTKNLLVDDLHPWP